MYMREGEAIVRIFISAAPWGIHHTFQKHKGKLGLEDGIFKLTFLWEYERKGNEITRGK